MIKVNLLKNALDEDYKPTPEWPTKFDYFLFLVMMWSSMYLLYYWIFK